MTTSKWKRRAGWALGSIGALVVVSLVAIRVMLGGGEPYPDVSTPPALGPDALEVLVELDMPPGNVTSSRKGRIFFNTHPFTEPQRFATDFVFELVDGEPRPYPSAELQPKLQGVLGMNVLHHVDDLPGALAELSRVLEPGACAAFSEPGLRHLEAPFTRRITPGRVPPIPESDHSDSDLPG